MFGEKDRAGIVGREQDTPLPDVLRQTQQAFQHAVHVSRAGLPEKAPGQVAGIGGGRPGSLVYTVNRYANPSEATDNIFGSNLSTTAGVLVSTGHSCPVIGPAAE